MSPDMNENREALSEWRGSGAPASDDVGDTQFQTDSAQEGIDHDDVIGEAEVVHEFAARIDRLAEQGDDVGLDAAMLAEYYHLLAALRAEIEKREIADHNLEVSEANEAVGKYVVFDQVNFGKIRAVEDNVLHLNMTDEAAELAAEIWTGALRSRLAEVEGERDAIKRLVYMNPPTANIEGVTWQDAYFAVKAELHDVILDRSDLREVLERAKRRYFQDAESGTVHSGTASGMANIIERALAGREEEDGS